MHSLSFNDPTPPLAAIGTADAKSTTSPPRPQLPQGVGLGLRRSMLPECCRRDGSLSIPPEIDFFEVAPENWIDQGGQDTEQFAAIAAARPLVCHGLSLNLGGFAPLDTSLLVAIRRFMEQHRIDFYSEHLAYTADHGQLYDLLPIPRCDAAVRRLAERIDAVQNSLGRRIAIENASAYSGTALDTLSEWEFYLTVAEAADCDLHLDVNNVYVNSVNFSFDSHDFLNAVAKRGKDRVVYFHVAGHYVERPDLLIDTHGMPVIDPVWQLLDESYRLFGPQPTLIERDFNIPPLVDLLPELATAKSLYQQALAHNQPRRRVNHA